MTNEKIEFLCLEFDGKKNRDVSLMIFRSWLASAAFYRARTPIYVHNFFSSSRSTDDKKIDIENTNNEQTIEFLCSGLNEKQRLVLSCRSRRGTPAPPKCCRDYTTGSRVIPFDLIVKKNY